VNLGGAMPLLSIGEKQVASAMSGWFPGIPDATMSTLTALSGDDPRDTAEMSAIRRTYRASKITEPEFGRVLRGLDAATAAKDADADSLEAQLDLVSRCVKAAVPTRVYMVSFGGFDTHADERGTHQDLLQIVDKAVTAFLRDVQTGEHGKNLVVMIYSEFGRRVRANSAQGTDHGAAGPTFIAGTPVKGGFYGDEPSLTDLNDGDLKSTTDFRDIYHELLSGVLKTDPTPSVGPGRRNLGFL
jgi:uncharacterized protein (DUF1501 family)